MSEAKSFIGEYSIGLSIVPYMKEILHEKYAYVTPISPWMTREGSNISKLLHRNDSFKIFGIFPRRPKLITDCGEIEFKINAQIIAKANVGLKYGIPIIAGCPLVRNFWELSSNIKLIWTRIDSEVNEDLFLTIKESDILAPALSLFNNNQEILDYIDKNAKLFSIEDALVAFRQINMTNSGFYNYPRFGFGGLYKAIYFLLK